MFFTICLANLIFLTILAILLGLTKACSDLMAHDKWAIRLPKFTNSYFNNVSITWANKYKNKDKSQGEAFIGSTTLFVFLTDGWHLFNMLNQVCLFLIFILLPITINSFLLAVIFSTIIIIIRTITFHVIYTYL